MQLSNATLRTQNLNLSRLLDEATLDSVERDVAEKIHGVLMEELHHRVKNMMAMVTAIVWQSLRTADNLVDAEKAISARLMAMSAAHALLLKVDWTSADLREVILGGIELHNCGVGRITVEGPKIEIASSSILPLTLILSELCTNSTKYGALSVQRGTVAFSWAMDTSLAFVTFRWVEKGGPTVATPSRRSFGSKLIEEALPRQLGGTGHLNFPSAGVEFELRVPLVMLIPATA